MFTSFEKLFMWFKKMFGDLNFMFNNVLFVLLHLRNQKNQEISRQAERGTQVCEGSVYCKLN
jgi:hypothetical protein